MGIKQMEINRDTLQREVQDMHKSEDMLRHQMDVQNTSIELCKPDNIVKLNSQRLPVYSFGSWNTQELADNNKGKILDSLKEPENESAEPAFLQLKQKGFVNLQEATFRACEITPWAKDAP